MTESSAVHQYLGLVVGGGEYALPILEVTEIVERAQLARRPGQPAGVRGFVDLRGRAVPVLDLSAWLGLPASSVTRCSCVVMVEPKLGRQGRPVGLLVDAVGQVMEVPTAHVEPPSSLPYARLPAGCLRAVARLGGARVPVLELGRLLEAEQALAAEAG